MDSYMDNPIKMDNSIKKLTEIFKMQQLKVT